MRTDFETPAVTVSSFKALPSEGLAPRFQIGLHIVNPNRTALKLQGVAYSISLEGHKIITGVANDLPEIAAYGEGQVIVTAVADVLNTIRLITGLMSQPRHEFNYEFNAKLDVGALLPAIRVLDRGSVSLDSGSASKPKSL
ncbi:MAG: LEA type 2 family protein [Motiliproteus sp.]